MIHFDQVTKLYDTVIGVNDISLDLEPGAYALLGPNGSGKTTLINLIMGQLRPTLGTVTIMGKNPWSQEELFNRIGLCPVSQASYPHVSGLDWVAYLTQMRGYSRAESKHRAREALTTLGMEHAMTRAMNGYSLGMRQRTVLAQAVTHDPDLLILDEPFNGLDPKGRIEMTRFLQKWTSNNKSLLVASHILQEVEALDPSLLLISGGRLLASGSADQVRSTLTNWSGNIVLRCRPVKEMATLLVSQFEVLSLRIDESQNSLEVELKHPDEFFRKLAGMAVQNNIKIDEIRAPESSLNHVFSLLMRIHRGEVHYSKHLPSTEA